MKFDLYSLGGKKNAKKSNNSGVSVNKKVCLDWLSVGGLGVNIVRKGGKLTTVSQNIENSSIVDFGYAEQFWVPSNYSKYINNSQIFTASLSPSLNTRNIASGACYSRIDYRSEIVDTFFKNKLGVVIFEKEKQDLGESFLKKTWDKDYVTRMHPVKFDDLGAISQKGRSIRRKYTGSSFICGNFFSKNLGFSKLLNTKKRQKSELRRVDKLKFSNKRYWAFFYRDAQRVYFKSLAKIGFPAINHVKKNHQTLVMKHNKYAKKFEYIILNQYVRHPGTVLNQTKKYLTTSVSFGAFSYGNKIVKATPVIYEKFNNTLWRYFKFQVEKFFYNQIGVRMHIWFLNIWDIFMGGLDSQWQWFRYENSTIRFLTRRGQRFLIETRDQAKYFVRAMALTLTMVGGAKFFMDKVSSMLKFHRNNWAFVLHVTKSLRFCINFFWFRFFINYKVTLQGKIGGFLRAAKKVYRRGKITIEDRAAAITYYRGFPVTRFGVYNLSLWIQYRIPSLIGKFEDLEYIDTMKILLGTYSVPWLAERLAGIVSAILQDRVYKKDVKVAQYDRRVRARHRLYLDVKKKDNKLLKENLGSLISAEKIQESEKISSILEKLNINIAKIAK